MLALLSYFGPLLSEASAVTLVQQPGATSAVLGAPAGFGVVAAGSGGISYQWRKNGTNITGATSATYSIPAVASADAGSYSVVVRDSAGSVTSSAAELTVGAYVWSNFAGATGAQGSSDGSPGSLNGPTGLVFGPDGSLYVGDSGNRTVRKITSGGTVSTFAGTAGLFGSTDAQGAAARFQQTQDATIDSSGNLYVADTTNHTIRKITPTGLVTTFAGLAGTPGAINGVGAAARFNQPWSVTIDPSGNLYVADGDNHAIRKITATGVVTTLAGSLEVSGTADGQGSGARFNSPYGVTADRAGNLYVADGNNHTIRKVTSDGTVTTLAGSPGLLGTSDGVGNVARFNYPSDLSVDAGGNLYLADYDNATVRKISPGGAVSTIGGSAGVTGATNGNGGSARFNGPSDVAVDGTGQLFVADRVNNVIRKGVFYTLPEITTQPANLAKAVGTSAQLKVVAKGAAPLSYQWRKAGANIAGATTDTLTMTGLATVDGGSYDVMVSNPAGSVTSTVATLKALIPAAITVQPLSATVGSGANVGLSVTATGSELTYQWRKNGVVISGATSANYGISYGQVLQSGAYDVVVSNGLGSVTSDVATLSVLESLKFVKSPSAAVVNPGGSITLTTTVTGAAPVSYQWRKGGAPIAGATAPTYTLSPVTLASAGVYDVVATNYVSSATSLPAAVTLNSPVRLEIQPVGRTVNPGASASLSVVAVGTAPLTYQWRRNGVPIAGATATTFTCVVQSAQAGSYDVVVSNAVGSVTSAQAVLALNVAPTITAHPAGGAVSPGGSKTLTVAVGGTPPFTYQWRRNGLAIAGGTAASYTISPITTASAGTYSVVVSNAVGSVTSSAAVLSLNTPVTITSQPAGGDLVTGASKTMTVSATGTAPLSYQWRRDGVAIAGATTASFTISNAQITSAGVYDVLVSNVVGSVASDKAVFKMAAPVVIITQPAGGNVLSGGSFKFSVTASGSGPLSYIWRKDGARLTAGSYSVVEGKFTWREAKADAEKRGGHLATVVNAAEWETIRVALGSKFNTMDLWMGATDEASEGQWKWVTGEPFVYQLWSNGEPNGSGSYMHKWVRGGNKWDDIPNVFWEPVGYILETESGGPTYEITNAGTLSAGTYDVVVSNPAGGVVSQTAKLALVEPLKIIAHPFSVVSNVGAPVAFSVIATGTGPLKYQWRKNGANIVGATSDTLRISPLQFGDAGSYDAVVTGATGSLTTTAATLEVNDLVITQQPVGGAVALGGSFTFNVKATGTSPITYKWRKNGVPIGNSVYTYVDGKMTWVQAKASAESKGGHLVTVSSAAEWVELSKQLGTNASKFAWIGGFQPSGSVEPKGSWSWVTGEPFTYTNWHTNEPNNVIRGGAPENSLQVNLPGQRATSWNDLWNAPDMAGYIPHGYMMETEAYGPSLSLSNVQLTDAATYDVVLFNPNGTVTSVAVTLNVQSPVVITQQPVGESLNPGASKTFSVSVTGTEPISFEWRRNGTPVVGGTARTLTIPVVAAGDVGLYSVVAKNLLNSVTSQAVPLTLNAPVTILTHPKSIAVNPGQPFSLGVVAGGTAPFKYQWRKDGNPILGATSGTLSVTATLPIHTGSYDVVVSNGVNSVTSSKAAVTLNVPVAITTHPVERTVNPGASASFSVVASGTAPLSYQWRKNGVRLAGGTAATLALTNVQAADAAIYDVVVTNVVNSSVSKGARLILNVAPAIVTHPSNVSANVGRAFSLNVQATGSAPLAYQWRKDGSPISGATNAIYSVPSAGTLSAGSYDVIVTNMVGSGTSNTAAVQINTPIIISSQPVSVALNPGAPLNLSVTATGTGPIAYQWRFNGKAIVGATAATFSLTQVSAANAGQYDVVLTNVVGSVTSAVATVQVNAPVLITTHPASVVINPGASKTLSVTATGTAPLTYQWRRNGQTLAGGTASSLAISTTLGEQAGNYDVVVTNVVGSVTSNTAVVSLNVPITILTHPQGLTGNPGAPVRLTVTASGTTPITYQWRKNGGNILGATAATYMGSLSAATVGNYDVVLTNVVGSGTSNVAVLALNSPVKILTQPEGQTVNIGDSASFAVVATGTAPLSYQWRRNGTNIAGATQATHSVPSAQVANAGAYSVVVTNPAGSVTSLTASLAVNPAANTKKYVYVSGNFTWLQAKAAAEARGGHLATVTSAEEWTAIVAQLGSSSNLCLWIGGFQPAGSAEPAGGWQWVTGEPFVYKNWAAGEPNNAGGNEAYMHVNWGNQVRGTWNDMSLAGGGGTKGYILEIEPILLTTQPASLTVTEGSPASFTVAADGSAPITYQWRKNGIVIAGATSATLTISPAGVSDAAGYDVLVKNAAGTITSEVATLSVTSPVIITKQPSSLVLNTGADATFSVEATGTAPITYQWRKGGTPIAGATSASLTLSPTQTSDAGSYDVVVTNPVGSVTCTPATLVFNDPIVIVTHPQGAVLNPGASVTLTVGATGTGPFSYQWRKDGRIIEKANAASYPVSNVLAASAGLYDVVVTNISNSATSNAAEIKVNIPVSILVQPVSLSVNPGEAANFSVTAAGTPDLTYQWRKNGVPIGGANTATFSVQAASLADAGKYDVVVSNIVGPVTSLAAVLSLNTPLTITTQPTGGAVNPNTAFTLRVAATGTAPIAYQWYRNGEAVAGATAASYTLASAQEADAGEYTVTLTNVVGSVTSAAAKVSLNVPVSILVQPDGLVLNPPTAPTVGKGESSPAPATPGTTGVLSVVATGTETLTYQWRKNGVPLAGATLANLTVEPKEPTGAGVYDVVITNVVGSVTSNPATVQLNTPLSIISHPASLVVNPGTLASFTVVAGGTAPMSYQWKKDGVPLDGGTSDSYSIATAQLSDVGRYEVVVTNVVGSITAKPASLALNTPLTFVTQPASLQVNSGSLATFSAQVEGTAPVTYQWRKDGVDIPGATSALFSLPTVSTLDAGSYELVATNIVASVSSAAAVLSVNEPVSVTTQPVGLAVNPGATATLSVVATGTAPLSYQWYRNGVALVGGTAATLSISPAQVADAGDYKVTISNTVGTVASASALLSINEAVSFSSQPQGATVLTGTPAKLTVTVAGTAPFTYQWSKGGVAIPGATAASYELVSAQESDSGSYSVEVTNVVGAAVSASAVLTVNTPLSITTQPASLTINSGSSATLAVVAAGTAPITYQWRKGGEPIAGAVQASLALNPVADADAGSYDVVLTNPAGSLTSEAAVLAVNLPVTILTQPAPSNVVSGNTLSLSVSVSGTAPITYQWRRDGVAIAGATSANLEVNPVQTSDAGSYDVVVSNVVGPVTSTAAAVTVLSPATITAQPVSLTVTAGSLATFTVTAEGTGPLSYQWAKDGIPVAGEVSTSFSITAAQAQDEGSYTVVVSNTTGPVTSAAATLTVLQPVTIRVHPLPELIAISGGSATFSVTAEGTGPLSYQWRKGGTAIVGGSSDSLVLNPVSGTDAGAYDVVVSNVTGSVTSSSGTLTVLEAPTITTQPNGATVDAGQPITLTVVAVGGGTLKYEWSKDGSAVPGGLPTLTIDSASVTNAGTYTVTVSNVAGSVTSNPAAVVVNKPLVPEPVSIRVQPKRTAGTLNAPSTLSVIAVGTEPISYQWYKDGVAIAGATSADHLIAQATGSDKGYYWVKVSNAVQINGQNSTATSSKVLFAILGAPSVTLDPVDQKVRNGTNFQLSAKVRCTQPFSYTWYQKVGDQKKPMGFGELEGGEEVEVTYSAKATAEMRGKYELTVSNSSGSDTSAPALLDVLLPSTRFIGQNWSYDLSSVNSGTLVTFSSSGWKIGKGSYKKWEDTIWPTAVSPTDTISVAYGTGDEVVEYQWSDTRAAEIKLPLEKGANLSLGPYFKNLGPNKKDALGNFTVLVTAKSKTGQVNKTFTLQFIFKVTFGTEETTSPKPQITFDLEKEYYAKENMDFTCGVGLAGTSTGNYTYTWYHKSTDDAAPQEVQGATSEYLYIPAGEMVYNLNSNGGAYPKEGIYWVVVADKAENTATSKEARLYIFSDAD